MKQPDKVKRLNDNHKAFISTYQAAQANALDTKAIEILLVANRCALQDLKAAAYRKRYNHE